MNGFLLACLFWPALAALVLGFLIWEAKLIDVQRRDG